MSSDSEEYDYLENADLLQDESERIYHQMQSYDPYGKDFSMSRRTPTAGRRQDPETIRKSVTFDSPIMGKEQVQRAEYSTSSQSSSTRLLYHNVRQNEQRPEMIVKQNKFNLFKILELAVEIDQLDIWKCGIAILSAYERGYDFTADVHRFLDKYGNSVKKCIMPSISCFNDSRFNAICTQGYAIFNQLVAYSPPIKPSESTKLTFSTLNGTFANCGARRYFYPKSKPFNGKPISFIELPRSSSSDAHVKLKLYLFTIIGRGFENPKDVFTENFVLPYDKDSRFADPTRFPYAFYTTLKDMFLMYFNLHSPELEEGKWNEEYLDLECLQSCSDERSKREYFEFLSAARKTFLETTFHFQLKQALNELKYGTYTEPEEGMRFGIFSYRKRGRQTPTRQIPVPALLGSEETSLLNVANESTGLPPPSPVSPRTDAPSTAMDEEMLIAATEKQLSQQPVQGKNGKKRAVKKEFSDELEPSNSSPMIKRLRQRRR